MAERVGQSFGNYHLLRLLGRGAFAEVYLAEHRYLEVPAAIKVLHVRIEPETHAQFLREARTIAHLQHPHIVRVLDFGFQDQTPYLVMEYTPNGTLRTQHPKGTRLPLEQIIHYLKQIAPALDYAHQQRVIHRDVKPENMLLSANDEVVLSDFGIAVIQRTMDSLSTQNQAGTPVYMAPEQIRGKPTAASDQYAVGVLVYEWLCGEPPFRGSLFEVLSQHLHATPPSLCDRVPSLPLAVEDAVFGALSKEPQERFVSMQEFAEVLEAVQDATQPLLLSLPSAPLAQEQIFPADGLPLSSYIPATKDLERSSSTTQTLVPPTPVQITVRDERLALSKHPAVPVSEMNRQRLMKKVRTFWITGVLEHSLHGNVLVALGLEEQPDAVANPWQLVLHHPAGAPRPLPVGTRITEVYDGAAGELLILGAPGSGKTTLLLEIARDLLERAQHDEQHPIPVVFNLSSWASKQQRLVDWLVQELISNYQVPRKLGQSLVDADEILPLIDGLDEVAPMDRTACIEAINTYRQEHGLLPLVVCSRSADYLAQSARVQLGSAVAVQPLTEQEVDDYLAHGGEPLRALRVAWHQDTALRELTNTPLMLSILALTYQDTPVEELLREASISERQRQIFERYVERMLRHRGTEKTYTPEQATRWLSWLARQMKQHSLTVFYIEHLQPTWLAKKQMRWVYGLWGIRIPAILMGILVSLIVSLSISWLLNLFSSGQIILPVSIVLGGFIGWLLSTRNTWRGSWGRLVKGARVGILIGPLIGLITGLSVGITTGLKSGLFAGSFVGLIAGLSGGLLGVLPIAKPGGISLTDELVWSWRSLSRSLLANLAITTLRVVALIGLCSGLLAALSGGFGERLITEPIPGLGFGLPIGLSYGLSYGLGFLLLFGLFQGVSGETIGDDRRLVPNQGIRRSVRNGLMFGLIGAGIVWLITLLSFGLSIRLSAGLSVRLDRQTVLSGLGYGLAIGLSAGLLAGLLNGGLASARHGVIRLLLWRAGSMPSNYPRFLDWAAEHILLRKVGGGYIFVHRLLLEYFASLESTATLEKTKTEDRYLPSDQSQQVLVSSPLPYDSGSSIYLDGESQPTSDATRRARWLWSALILNLLICILLTTTAQGAPLWFLWPGLLIGPLVAPGFQHARFTTLSRVAFWGVLFGLTNALLSLLAVCVWTVLAFTIAAFHCPPWCLSGDAFRIIQEEIFLMATDAGLPAVMYLVISIVGGILFGAFIYRRERIHASKGQDPKIK